MNIALPEPLRAYVAERVESGQYGNTSEYVRERPLVRDDRRSEVRYYRKEARARVALRLVALAEALEQISRDPGIGSPTLGRALGIPGMRTCSVRGFPLTFWYFEREARVDVARLAEQRQGALGIDVGEP
jgi:toxin ParE1/3/4